MGETVVSLLESRKKRVSFTKALASALLEWLLISMLLVDGVFGYIITKFARYCELPIPCLLCSRIDHILGSEKAGYYWDLICGNHKVEISTLVFCQFHEKLVDVRGMCENCLFSFATKDKSNAETYRLLVGKLGEEDLSGFDEDPILDGRKRKNLSMKHCSCCNELWSSRRHAQTMFQTKSIEFDSADVEVPLSREFRQDEDDFRKEAKTTYQSMSVTHNKVEVEDSSAHFQYTELKINSDTESEIQASDNEDTRALIFDDPLRDLILDSAPMEPFIRVFEDDSSCNKPIDLDVLSFEPSQVLFQLESDIIQPCDNPSAASAPAIGHGLEELTWQSIDHKLHQSASTNPMNFNHEPESSSSENVSSINHVPESSRSENVSTNVYHVPESSSSENFSTHVNNVPESSRSENVSTNVNHVPESPISENVSTNVNHVPESSISENVDISKDELNGKEADNGQTLAHEINKNELDNSLIATDSNSSKMKADNGDGGFQMPNYLDLGDAYKLATRGRQLSGKLTEQLAGKDSRVSGDLKLLLSQFSRGFELSSNDTLSPRVYMNLDEFKTYDASASIGMKLLQKRLSLERNDSRTSLDRNESGFESLDFSTVSDIEGESELERLKRQIEHDRKFMIALLKELEEERNASTIAANEAMAMITRLQEEKAALQMEASQDLRMMEEQAEYDMEALEKLNNLITEKDKEIQDLEAELEYFRTKNPNESFLEPVSDLSQGERPESASDIKDSWLDFEDEREYLLQSLRNLDKKLNLLSSNTVCSDMTVNGDHLEKKGEDSYDSKPPEEGSLEKSEMDENDIMSQKDPKSAGKGISISKEADLVSLGYELSNLNERLQALEADRTFLERVIKTLKNGDEGMIQEIASHLRELRKIGTKLCLADNYHPSQRWPQGRCVDTQDCTGSLNL